MLANSLTDEEILEEIRRFRKHHEDINVLLYDSPHTELMNSMTYRTLENNLKCGIIYSIKVV